MKEHMPDDLIQEQKRRKRRKFISVALAWLLVILVVAAIAVCAFAIGLTVGGEKSLKGNTTTQRPNLSFDDMEESSDAIVGSESGAGTESNNTENSNQTSEDSVASNGGETSGAATEPVQTAEPEVVWQDHWVRYNGKVYEYNQNITNILVMGIDKEETVSESSSVTGGGQNDANFLVIINPDEKDIKILAINRDTMTDINMYGAGKNGENIVAYAQLAVQHGFGDGKELSCELTRDAVSTLFYDLPIHGYVSVNMAAISQINDAIGGVEVTVLEDVKHEKTNLKKGETVTLLGRDAFWYVKYRDINIEHSNVGRLARQKQYLNAYTTKVKEAVKKDITLPVALYQQLSKYMVTDISVDEVAYLAMNLLDYSVDGEHVYTLEGTSVRGEKFEEFYPDKAAKKDLMIQLFYKEVDVQP